MRVAGADRSIRGKMPNGVRARARTPALRALIIIDFPIVHHFQTISTLRRRAAKSHVPCTETDDRPSASSPFIIITITRPELTPPCHMPCPPCMPHVPVTRHVQQKAGKGKRHAIEIIKDEKLEIDTYTKMNKKIK